MEQQYPSGTNENYCSFSLRIPVTQNDTNPQDNEKTGGGAGEPGFPATFSRKATMEDFFDDGAMPSQNNKYNKNHSRNDNGIEKNQQEFGHKKRIKP
jgi:hypothetical protein